VTNKIIESKAIVPIGDTSLTHVTRLAAQHNYAYCDGTIIYNDLVKIKDSIFVLFYFFDKKKMAK
jgi:hypothetical protein